jgi:hypothetical protein
MCVIILIKKNIFQERSSGKKYQKGTTADAEDTEIQLVYENARIRACMTFLFCGFNNTLCKRHAFKGKVL